MQPILCFPFEKYTLVADQLNVIANCFFFIIIIIKFASSIKFIAISLNFF